MREDLHQQLRQSSWFNGLPEHCQLALAEHAKIKKVVSQEVIHTKGQQSSGLYYVCEGKIRVSNFTPDGKEVILTWLTGDNWFGEISLFDQLPRTHQTTADAPSTLINIPHREFQKVIALHPELYEFFIPIFCQRIRLLFELIEEARTLPVKQQLIRRLLHLSYSELSGTKQTKLALDVSQESLALMLNTTRQSVNRWLNELQSDGLIELAYNKINIVSIEKLQDCIHL